MILSALRVRNTLPGEPGLFKLELELLRRVEVVKNNETVSRILLWHIPKVDDLGGEGGL